MFINTHLFVINMPMVKKTVKKMVPPVGLDTTSFCHELDSRCNFRFIEVEEEVWTEELVEYA